MPHYHCHLHGPAGCEHDEVGLEFADLDAVYLDVCRAIRDMSADFARAGHDPMPYAFEIVDAAGARLMDVPFREMLNKGDGPRRATLPVSPVALRAGIVRAEQLREAIVAEMVNLAETMRQSRVLVVRSRIASAADPWTAAARDAVPVA